MDNFNMVLAPMQLAFNYIASNNKLGLCIEERVGPRSYTMSEGRTVLILV